MIIDDRNLVELIGLGTCLRFIGQKAESVAKENEKTRGAGTGLIPPVVERVEVEWTEAGLDGGAFCKVTVHGSFGVRSGVKIPCPFEWTPEIGVIT